MRFPDTQATPFRIKPFAVVARTADYRILVFELFEETVKLFVVWSMNVVGQSRSCV